MQVLLFILYFIFACALTRNCFLLSLSYNQESMYVFSSCQAREKISYMIDIQRTWTTLSSKNILWLRHDCVDRFIFIFCFLFTNFLIYFSIILLFYWFLLVMRTTCIKLNHYVSSYQGKWLVETFSRDFSKEFPSDVHAKGLESTNKVPNIVAFQRAMPILPLEKYRPLFTATSYSLLWPLDSHEAHNYHHLPYKRKPDSSLRRWRWQQTSGSHLDTVCRVHWTQGECTECRSEGTNPGGAHRGAQGCKRHSDRSNMR